MRVRCSLFLIAALIAACGDETGAPGKVVQQRTAVAVTSTASPATPSPAPAPATVLVTATGIGGAPDPLVTTRPAPSLLPPGFFLRGVVVRPLNDELARRGVVLHVAISLTQRRGDSAEGIDYLVYATEEDARADSERGEYAPPPDFVAFGPMQLPPEEGMSEVTCRWLKDGTGRAQGHACSALERNVLVVGWSAMYRGNTTLAAVYALFQAGAAHVRQVRGW